MLSAIAARKARLAGKPVLSSDIATPLPSPLPVPATRRPSKRKLSEPIAKPKKKRRPRQDKPVEDNRPRYFQEYAFTKQQNIVNIRGDDSDDSDDSDASKDNVPVDGRIYERTGLVSQPAAVPPCEHNSTSRGRAWSPSAPLRDSSEEQEVDMVDDEVEVLDDSVHVPARHVPCSPTIMSTFQPVVNQNTFPLTPDEVQDLHLPPPYSEQRGTLLVLFAEDTLVLLGTYALSVLQGSISLCGVTLLASCSTYPVFAPRSSPLPVIETLSQSRPSGENVAAFPSRVLVAAASSSAVILLQELRTGIEGLGAVCRAFDGVFTPSRWQEYSASSNLRLSGVHLISSQTHGMSPLSVLGSWESAIATALERLVDGKSDSRQVYLVKGPRNSGKSTFARMLANRLLMRYRLVAFLECDVGQSEFTPGGMVALNVVDCPMFGPPFSHPSIPHAAHFVGAATPRSCPSQYLESIQALVQSYNVNLQQATLLENADTQSMDDKISDVIPLVVNTMGWTKGLGADLSRKIEEVVEPSEVFETETQFFEDSWVVPDIARPSRVSDVSTHGTKLHRIECTPLSMISSQFTAADHRILSIMSYFHAIFSFEPPASRLCLIRATFWDATIPLRAKLPYEVDCNIAFDSIVLVGAGMEDVVHSEVHHVLNGAVVGLISYEPGTLDTLDVLKSIDTLPYSQHTRVPSPFASNCHGLALIRSLSATRTLLHVLTPLPPHLLTSARALIKAEMELPVYGFLDYRTADNDAITGTEVPYLTWEKSKGAGGDRRRVRRNLMRRSQM